MAAEDILRSHYLATTFGRPQSLANLDQDLPNNLRVHVHFYLLCMKTGYGTKRGSKDRRHRAKIIDFCQNPLTERAEARARSSNPGIGAVPSRNCALHTRLTKKGRIHASAAAADVTSSRRPGPFMLPIQRKRRRRTGEVEVEVSSPPIRDKL
ncbi:hypothetical protein EI94DRAFT_1831552 [Lactarius quietus]|nr:hypothetical protein EI94DRAFT_1831552 [Lactarius quietus]